LSSLFSIAPGTLSGGRPRGGAREDTSNIAELWADLARGPHAPRFLFLYLRAEYLQRLFYWAAPGPQHKKRRAVICHKCVQIIRFVKHREREGFAKAKCFVFNPLYAFEQYLGGVQRVELLVFCWIKIILT